MFHRKNIVMLSDKKWAALLENIGARVQYVDVDFGRGVKVYGFEGINGRPQVYICQTDAQYALNALRVKSAYELKQEAEDQND